MFGNVLGGLFNSLFNNKSNDDSDTGYRSNLYTPTIDQDQNYAKSLKYNQVAGKQAMNEQLEYADKTAPLYTSIYAKKSKIDAQKGILDSAKDLYKYAGQNAKYWD